MLWKKQSGSSARPFKAERSRPFAGPLNGLTAKGLFYIVGQDAILSHVCGGEDMTGINRMKSLLLLAALTGLVLF
ncbi:MAG: hypothetical protein ACRD9Y_08015, partial [Blastocatellia bacterium]